jgi:BRCT domain type II-containing protein
MKTAIFAVILFLSAQTAIAMDGEKTRETFQKHKEIKIKALEERIAIQEKELSCVKSANADGDVKACAEKAKEAHEELNRRIKEMWESAKDK